MILKKGALFTLNELMTFLTIIIVFPGFFPPRNRMEIVMMVLFFIPMSVVWWLFLAVFPFAYLALWWSGELAGFNPFFHKWPFA